MAEREYTDEELDALERGAQPQEREYTDEELDALEKQPGVPETIARAGGQATTWGALNPIIAACLLAVDPPASHCLADNGHSRGTSSGTLPLSDILRFTSVRTRTNPGTSKLTLIPPTSVNFGIGSRSTRLPDTR